MLWSQHVLSTQIVFGEALTWSDVLWSIAPDIPMIFLVGQQSWSLIQDWWVYSVFYKIPHSIFVLIFIQNTKARKVYGLHILMDVLTHTGRWSIEPFWPLGPPVSGLGDAGVWV